MTAVWWAALAAQEPLAVRGAVVAESGERVPYAVVALSPGFPQQFAAPDGRFVFSRLRSGTYRLVVRQVGYRPYDTTVTVQSLPVSLRVTLRRIAVALPALAIESDAPCTRPGAPDRDADPALADLFEQLRENALRSRVLAESYPHRYFVVRRLYLELDDGTNRMRSSDTLEIASSDRWQYRPGKVVDLGRGNLAGVRVVHLPELADLADSVFHRYHCFSAAGVDTVGGAPLIRLDFKAAASLRSPDVNGSAWLDQARYQLRRLRIELTRPERAIEGVRTMAATATFREELPYIAVVEQLLALTLWAVPEGGVVGQSEEQQLVRVEFERRPGEERP
jgi:hypothetical protein